MPAGRITNSAVAALEPSSRDVYLWDDQLRGFALKVTPGGRRIFLVQYRVGRRTRRVTIGPLSEAMPPATARRKARELLGIVATGGDPAETRKASKEAMSVEALCRHYLGKAEAGEILGRDGSPKKASTLLTDRGRILRHIIPVLGHRDVASLTSQDVRYLQSQITSGATAKKVKTGKYGLARVRGGAGTATRTLGLFGGIMQFAVEEGLRSDNPVRGVRRRRDASIERSLSSAEFAALGDALANAESEGLNQFGIAALRLLAFTGARRGEVLGLHWSYVDFENALLRLPDSKTGRKTIPLGPAALQILADLPRMAGTEYVFPAARGHGPYRGLTKLWFKVRESAGLPDLRIHDLRHAFASVGASSGLSLYLIAKALGHRDQATTQKYAHVRNDPVAGAAAQIEQRVASAMMRSGDNALDPPDAAAAAS